MKWTKNLLLFILLLALAAYVYFYEIKGGEKREQAKQEADLVFQFEPDSVKSLEVRSALADFFFRREGEKWQILKPVMTDAEKSTISSALSTLKSLKKEREFSVQKNELKSYGLVGTSMLVIFELTGGKRDSVRFGDDTPIGSNAFAGKVDTLVFMVPNYAKRNFVKTLFDWREKSVSKVKQADVQELILQNPQGKFHLVKEGSDWQLNSPLSSRADNSTVSSILSKLEFGRATGVASETFDQPSRYRLNKPAYRIELLVGEARAQKNIIISDLKDNVAYVNDLNRPQVFTVDSTFIKEINKSLFQLRFKKIAEFDRDGADSLVVNQGDSVFIFNKDTSSAWYLSGNKRVKTWKMNSLLTTLNNLSAKKFLLENVPATAEYGLSKPERTITLYRGGEKIQQVLFASPAKNLKVAFSPYSRQVAEIEDSAYNNTKITASEYVDVPPPPSPAQTDTEVP
jgi:Domain of unknown function (DUF4340)